MANNSEKMTNESLVKNQGLAARKRRFSSEKFRSGNNEKMMNKKLKISRERNAKHGNAFMLRNTVFRNPFVYQTIANNTHGNIRTPADLAERTNNINNY